MTQHIVALRALNIRAQLACHGCTDDMHTGHSSALLLVDCASPPMWLGVHLCAHIAGLHNHQEVQVASRSRLSLAQGEGATWIGSYMCCSNLLCNLKIHIRITIFVKNKQVVSVWVQSNLFIFIRPESDHWLCLSLTWLTEGLTNCCLVNLIVVTLACEDANSKLVEVFTVADLDA